jgi:hypothetical protein
MRDEQDRISRVLESLDGISPAQANPFLYGKIMNRMQARQNDRGYTAKALTRIAFLLMVLTALNIASTFRSARQKSETDASHDYLYSPEVFEYEQP